MRALEAPKVVPPIETTNEARPADRSAAVATLGFVVAVLLYHLAFLPLR